MLIVISGLPGTGKTAVASEVARQIGAVHLSIDTIEDALIGAGLPGSWTTGVAAYEAARAAAEQNLRLGRIVIVDAVNDGESARETWRRAAAAAGAQLAFVLLTLNDQVEHRHRLDGRRRNMTNIPEPSWDAVRQRAAEFEPWLGEHLRLSAAGTIEQLSATVITQLDIQ